MKYYFKFLGHDRHPCHGGRGQWPLPGEWTETIPNLRPCESGYHLCRKQDLIEWSKSLPLWWRNAPTLWIAEVDPVDLLTEVDKVVAHSARLVRQVEEWNEKNQRLFAADCAEHVLKYFEADQPNDTRPRQAILTARKFAIGGGQATIAELADVRNSVPWISGADPAYHAAAAASRATWANVRLVALSAIRAVSGSGKTAWSAERTWQTNRLLTHYLNLNPEDFE